MAFIARYKTPDGFDDIRMSSDGEALTGLWFDGSPDEAKHGLAEESSRGQIFRETCRWLDIYFSGHEPDFTPPYRIDGLTPFRRDVVEEMRLAFEQRRNAIVAGLSSIPGVICPTPEGAFYVYPDVTGLLGRTWGGVTPTTSLELADLILEQAEVAVVPGEAFGPSGYLRFSYALGDAPLLEGIQRLQRLFAR
jgi:hypothetical protein